MADDPRHDLKNWIDHEEVVAMMMAEYGLTREEVEKTLEQFDADQPWNVDKKPPQ